MQDFILYIIGAIVILGIFVIIVYNKIVSAKNNIEESFSAIDSVLQNRYDLIPNLIETVKQYTKHESEVFTRVTELRSSLLSNANSSANSRFQNENELFNGMKSIFAIAENYPELNSSANFLELQTQWSEIEDRLQASRRAYNSAVKELKNLREQFPTNIVAKMFTFQDYYMFEADEQAKKSLNAKNLFNS